MSSNGGMVNKPLASARTHLDWCLSYDSHQSSSTSLDEQTTNNSSTANSSIFIEDDVDMANYNHDPVIMRIENTFEQKYFQQICINNGLKKRGCLLLIRQSRLGKDGRLYCYNQRYSYIDGVFFDCPDDETFWNAKYGKFHYHDRTKEQNNRK